jgi:hypothetical protein
MVSMLVVAEENRLVPRDGEREFVVRRSPGRDPGVVEADEVVPVPGPALAPDATLKAVDVHQAAPSPGTCAPAALRPALLSGT